jgi:histidyl-tRNA synthetase
LADLIKAIRGMHDVLPEHMHTWHHFEQTVQALLASYGYHEIRFPIVEKTQLFKRGIGEVTDIVEKEMYTFEDRNGDSLSLRPEGTACCVRAALEAGLLHNQQQKFWYSGPMFRHERPQKGRYRQFHQIGVEAFGMAGPDIDAELIAMSARLWQQLGLSDVVSLQLNSLGTSECRQRYRAALVDYLSGYRDQLDEDSQRRLGSNPLRILDSKDATTQEILKQAPVLEAFLSAEARTHFAELCRVLDALNIKYEVNTRLVRGLDYYSHTVFEWVTDKLGAQGTVCAGGRFDALVTMLGGRATPAMGMAMGIERLIALMDEMEVAIPQQAPHAYMVLVGEAATFTGIKVAEQLRTALPGLKLITNQGGGGFKPQIKRADKSQAHLALILGDDEVNNASVGIKFLREAKDQITISQAELPGLLEPYINS